MTSVPAIHTSAYFPIVPVLIRTENAALRLIIPEDDGVAILRQK